MGHDDQMPASDPAAPDRPGAAPVLQIGEVAKRVDLSIRTIRHWEDMGLITPSARSSGGFRLYSEEDVSRIRLLRFMKPLNLTLEQMRELLEIRARLTASAADPDDRIAALVWPRGTEPATDRDALVARLAEVADLADRRLEKLRAYVAEVEEFLGRLRKEVAEGAGDGSGPAPLPGPLQGGAQS
jgi:DNA-binding transcriptional MerR regulator